MNERQLMLGLAIFAGAFLWAPAAHAGNNGTAVVAALQAKYRQHQARLPAHPSPPITVELVQSGRSLRGDIYAALDHPYAQVVEALRHGRNWCEIASLHLNVKGCTHEPRLDAVRLIFYSGRKYYQPPEAARPFAYTLRVHAHGPDYFHAVLTPDKARSDTEQDRILVEAIPLGRGRVFLHVRYSVQYSPWMQTAAGGYFATFGRYKTGFSTVGTDRQGRPILVRGMTGALERNIVRYYLALHVYFSTRDLPEPDRHEQRLSRWFDLTEQYAVQLREIGKPEYFSSKRRERIQQARLQAAIDASTVEPHRR